MRRAVLLRSVDRVLGGTEVRAAAYMWARHRWTVPFAVLVFAAVVLFAPVAGIDDWPTRAVVGAAAAAVGVTATTDYRVLAHTDDGLVLLAASRIRHVATSVVEWLPADAALEPAGGTMLMNDWQVGGRRYTVSRSSEQDMQRMATAE